MYHPPARLHGLAHGVPPVDQAGARMWPVTVIPLRSRHRPFPSRGCWEPPRSSGTAVRHEGVALREKRTKRILRHGPANFHTTRGQHLQDFASRHRTRGRGGKSCVTRRPTVRRQPSERFLAVAWASVPLREQDRPSNRPCVGPQPSEARRPQPRLSPRPRWSWRAGWCRGAVWLYPCIEYGTASAESPECCTSVQISN